MAQRIEINDTPAPLRAALVAYLRERVHAAPHGRYYVTPDLKQDLQAWLDSHGHAAQVHQDAGASQFHLKPA